MILEGSFLVLGDDNMIYVYLDGHNYEHDLFELIRVFFPKDEIVFIKDRMEYKNQGYLVQNILSHREGKLLSVSSIHYNGTIIKDFLEDIDSINIHRNTLEQNIKVGIKKSIYNCLVTLSDNDVPWGILTGIRPVKIVHDLMGKNIPVNTIYSILRNEYKLAENKANLIISIANKQRKYIYPISDKYFSLYVSIPFCPTRCVYCSFPAYALGRYDNLIETYVDKLIYEIRNIKDIMSNKTINTVYIGGGTPTAIPTIQLERIIKSIYNNFDKNKIKEFTVEAGRPDTINTENLSMLKDMGIRRISINPQTMNDKTLKLIGRNHTSSDIIKSYNLAKNIGIDIINMDLIIGLPGEGIEEIKSTLREIEKLNPENLTVHTLAVKRGSKFKEEMDSYTIESQKILQFMLDETINFSERMNLIPYYLYRQKQILGNFENIGYCKENLECIYNVSIMEEKETIIAAGVGAISKIYYPEENRIERIPNYKDLLQYLNRVEDLIDRKKLKID